MNTAKGTTPTAMQIKLQQEAGINNGVGESFRVLYYGSAAAGSVPFMWESHPGTPKHALTESSLPPLTPPPSYHQRSQKYNSSKHLINPDYHSSNSGGGFLRKLFLPSYRKRISETWFSSSSLSSSFPWNLHLWQLMPVSKPEVRQEHAGGGSPVPVRCLGGGFKRSYRIGKMKKVIQSYVRPVKTK
ncbi:hypothetical protein R6Q59_014338 [Mikania micrantha]|uniref:Uncharacterized protein n=1 Tax=Mikania micrantha TaxID=192012 RepID=A0A5N6LF30_9ASTR|nr:hypothetical protein E3N88_43384 [Mikania micrantha]